MFKRIIKLVLFSCLFHVPAPGQTIFKFNQYDIIYSGDFMPVVTLYASYQINKTFGVASYFYVNAYPKNSWGEGLIGPLVTPVKGITIGFLGGYQSNETELWRISPLLILSFNPWSFYGAFEFGGKRYRWDCMGFYSVKNFKFGGEFIRFYQMYTAGPRIEFTFFKKQPITVFYTALWDWTYGKYSSMFGIYTVFGPFGKTKPLDD